MKCKEKKSHENEFKCFTRCESNVSSIFSRCFSELSRSDFHCSNYKCLKKKNVDNKFSYVCNSYIDSYNSIGACLIPITCTGVNQWCKTINVIENNSKGKLKIIWRHWVKITYYVLIKRVYKHLFSTIVSRGGWFGSSIVFQDNAMVMLLYWRKCLLLVGERKFYGHVTAKDSQHVTTKD